MSNSLDELYNIVLERKSSGAENSYTRYLFEQGLDKILKKLGEECSETIIAAKNLQNERSAELVDELVGEVSDLLYHLLVLLAETDVSLSSVCDELGARADKQGNLKQFHSTDKNT